MSFSYYNILLSVRIDPFFFFQQYYHENFYIKTSVLVNKYSVLVLFFKDESVTYILAIFVIKYAILGTRKQILIICVFTVLLCFLLLKSVLMGILGKCIFLFSSSSFAFLNAILKLYCSHKRKIYILKTCYESIVQLRQLFFLLNFYHLSRFII